MRRDICTLGDLPDILDQEAFVVNKFDTALDPEVVEWIRSRLYPKKELRKT